MTHHISKAKIELAEAIARRIEETGLTQAEAARQMGITRPTTSKIVNGRIERHALATLIGAAEKFGLPVDLRVSIASQQPHGVPAE